MRILMMTNTYQPIIGGLERSIEIFSNEYRKKGHDVFIVAPEHKEAPKEENGILRVPAIQNFNGTDFSVELPIHFELLKKLDEYQPEIVHAHHPFLIGDTALRISERYQIPLVFTHHTLYEEYTHYVSLKAGGLKRFVMNLATEYANLCDYVFAPSESIARLIKQRGVKTKIDVIPTGIYVDQFAKGDGARFRKKLGIKNEAFIVGTVGRIAPEKNIEFLAQVVIRYLKKNNDSAFLVVGSGTSLDVIKNKFNKAGLSSRLFCTGPLKGQELIDAYHAMNVFAFASHSETQGLVLIESMATGIPVVAVDAPGVREVVDDGVNGRLIEGDDSAKFTAALEWFSSLPDESRHKVKQMSKATADKFSVSCSVNKALSAYEQLLKSQHTLRSLTDNPWMEVLSLIKAEMKLAKSFTKATTAVLNSDDQ